MSQKKLLPFYFTIDLRSLGLFRILLGCMLILDWSARWPSLEAFYTSSGFVPIESPLPKAGGEFHFSLLDGATSLPMVQTLFVLGLVCYLMLLVGLHTRCFHVLSFVFFASLLSRNSIILHGGDFALGTMLMWSMFLPRGERFSVDRLLRAVCLGVPASSPREPSPEGEETLSCEPSLAALAIVCQIALIYYLTAFDKYGDEWRDGTALYYALQIDQLATPLGHWVARWPLGWIKLLTWATLAVEYAAAPLILLPLAQPLLRRIAIVLLCGLHLGTWLMMELGLFPFVTMSTYALLLEAEDWKTLRRWARKAPRCVIGYYDDACVLCRRGVQWLALSDGLPDDRGVVAPASVAPLRLRFKSPRRLLMNVFVGVIFVAVLINSYNLNVAAPLYRPQIVEPRLVRAVIQTTQLIQDWNLFAPYPMKDDGWWVINGVTESGERFDPLTGRTPTWEKPKNLAARYNAAWRIYLYRLWLRSNSEYRLYFARHITVKNHREKPPGQRLVQFDFYYVLETTQPPGSPQPFPTERVFLWHHDCFGGQPKPPSPTKPPSPAKPPKSRFEARNASEDRTTLAQLQEGL